MASMKPSVDMGWLSWNPRSTALFPSILIVGALSQALAPPIGEFSCIASRETSLFRTVIDDDSDSMPGEMQRVVTVVVGGGSAESSATSSSVRVTVPSADLSVSHLAVEGMGYGRKTHGSWDGRRATLISANCVSIRAWLATACSPCRPLRR